MDKIFLVKRKSEGKVDTKLWGNVETLSLPISEVELSADEIELLKILVKEYNCSHFYEGDMSSDALLVEALLKKLESMTAESRPA